MPILVAILVRKQSRKLLLDTLESILAVMLVIILLGIVLGLPVGKTLQSSPHLPHGSGDIPSGHQHLQLPELTMGHLEYRRLS